jgi:hypothetical protein
VDKLLNVFELYADADNSDVKKFNERLTSKMDVNIETNRPKSQFLWIQKMEDTVEYLDNILRNPTKLIVNEEEVVKIEKIKKVTVESIKNLAKNSSFIDDVDENGEVKPGKLLNVFKEETFNTYENRFIYTLVQKMLIIIKKEKDKLVKDKSKDKEFKKFDYQGKSYNGKNKVDIQIMLTASTESTGKSDEVKRQLDRIRALEKNIINLTLTATYQELDHAHVPLVTPPLKKTNVLLKNVNFQYAVKLWDFLITEMGKKSEENTNETKVKKYKDRGKAKKFVDETFLLDYLILECVENPEISGKRKKELLEQLIANVVERTIDVNENLTEEQLKNLVSKQYRIVKYRRTTSNKEIQEIFKKHIAKYVQKINKFESER